MDKFLVYRVGFGGDIVLTSAARCGIKKTYPDCELTFVVWQQFKDLLIFDPFVDKLMMTGRYMTSDFSKRLDFRHEAKMPRFVGDKDQHLYWGAVHAYQARDVGMLDIKNVQSFKPSVYISPGDLAERKSEERLIVVNAWSSNGIGWRLWDIEKWKVLVKALHEKGYKTIQLGGRDDPPVGATTNLCGRTSLLQAIGVLAICDLAICIDSLIGHLGHSMKYVRDVEKDTIEKIRGSVPTVLLAGPIAPSCVVPEDAKCVPVSSYPDCDGPCGISHPGTPAGRICKFKNSCMGELSIETVMEGVEKCLDSYG